MSDYYDVGGVPSFGAPGDSSQIRNEFKAVQDGISNKLPTLSGNALKIIGINAGATKMDPVATTGTGSVVLATGPTLSALTLGTPLPIASGGTASTTANAAADALGAYRKGTILGTVSQSAGVPTGAIIETGSNANGTYTKWADGTMICSVYKDVGSIAITSALGALYYSASTINITYPAAFVGAYPAVTQNLLGTSGVSWATCANASLTLSQYYSLSYASFTQQHYIFVVAVGRWF